jgi:hypothetical protein
MYRLQTRYEKNANEYMLLLISLVVHILSLYAPFMPPKKLYGVLIKNPLLSLFLML